MRGEATPGANFDRWLSDQQLDPGSLSEEIKAPLREEYERGQLRGEALQASTLSPGTTGGSSYAIAIEDGPVLRVTLWVKRSPKVCVVLYPRDSEWDPHATYHLDGRYHSKSYGTKSPVQRRQRLDLFKGTEHLGIFMGHGPPLPTCKPADYTDVIRVPAGVLTGHKGGVMVDLVEPGIDPNPLHRAGYDIVCEKVYKDCSPWVVVGIGVPQSLVI